MSCGKCGCGKGVRLCPISFGLALGLTFGLIVFLWAAWAMFHGLPVILVQQFHFEPLTWINSTIYALWAFLKGFILGVVIALFYNLFSCCCKCRACKRTDVKCGCSCCSTTNTTNVNQKPY